MCTTTFRYKWKYLWIIPDSCIIYISRGKEAGRFCISTTFQRGVMGVPNRLTGNRFNGLLVYTMINHGDCKRKTYGMPL